MANNKSALIFPKSTLEQLGVVIYELSREINYWRKFYRNYTSLSALMPLFHISLYRHFQESFLFSEGHSYDVMDLRRSDYVAASWLLFYECHTFILPCGGSTCLAVPGSGGTVSQHGMAPACTSLLQLLSGSQNEPKPNFPEVKSKYFDPVYHKHHEK